MRLGLHQGAEPALSAAAPAWPHVPLLRACDVRPRHCHRRLVDIYLALALHPNYTSASSGGHSCHGQVKSHTRPFVIFPVLPLPPAVRRRPPLPHRSPAACQLAACRQRRPPPHARCPLAPALTCQTATHPHPHSHPRRGPRVLLLDALLPHHLLLHLLLLLHLRLPLLLT